jgi:hypothetical protein
MRSLLFYKPKKEMLIERAAVFVLLGYSDLGLLFLAFQECKTRQEMVSFLWPHLKLRKRKIP